MYVEHLLMYVVIVTDVDHMTYTAGLHVLPAPLSQAVYYSSK